MKLSILKLAFIMLFLIVSFAQAQSDEKETLKQINQQVVFAYQSAKYDDAIKYGRQAVDLSLKIYGANNRETAVAYTNLGVIYQNKKKFKESIENLQRAIEVYESISDVKLAEKISAYETLAFSQTLGGKKTEAEATYLKAIETAEMKLGAASKETLSPTLSLANLYARDKNINKAHEYYLKSYTSAVKNFGGQAKQIEQIEDSRICFVTTQDISFQKPETFKSFYEERKKILGEVAEQSAILNARAKLLPQPTYPAEAKSKGIFGSAAVRVKIDGRGNVFETKPICGNELLTKATEDAVKNARFEAVAVDGKPVKYSGVIIYNYK